MIYRIVIRCNTLNAAAKTLPRIRGVVARNEDTVARGGYLIEVLTEYPEQFIAAYFEEGFNHTFTCGLEIQ